MSFYVNNSIMSPENMEIININNDNGNVIQILDEVDYREVNLGYPNEPEKVKDNEFHDEDSFTVVNMEYPNTVDKAEKVQDNQIINEDIEYSDKNHKDEKVQTAEYEIDCGTPQEPNNKHLLNSTDIISNAEYGINIKHCCDLVDTVFKYKNYNDYLIEIPKAEKMYDYIGTSYIAYSIQIVTNEGHQVLFEAKRRYSEFDMLQKHLIACFPNLIIPPIPEKSNLIEYATGSNNAMVEKRKRMLQSFLNKLRKHPVLCRMHLVHLFIQQESKWYSTEDTHELQKSIDKNIPLINEEKLTEIKNKLLLCLEYIKVMYNIQLETSKSLQELSELYSTSNEIYKNWSSEEEPYALELKQIGNSGKTLYFQLQSTLQKMNKFIIDTLDQYQKYIEIAMDVRKNYKNEYLKFQNISKNLENKRKNLKYMKKGLKNTITSFIDTDPVNTRRNEISNIRKSIEELEIEYEKQKDALSVASLQLDTSIQQFEKEKREDFFLLFKQFAKIHRDINDKQYEFWCKVKLMNSKKDN